MISTWVSKFFSIVSIVSVLNASMRAKASFIVYALSFSCTATAGVEDIKDDSVMSSDKLMRDIKALLENQGAVIPDGNDIVDDDDDDDTVTEDNDGDGGGIRMESGPQQILLNGRDRDDIDEIHRGRNRSWSSEDEEEEEQEQLLRKRSASSRKNVHFR